MRSKVVLHVCCGPCATESIKRLKKDYTIVLFYPNSNIFPKDEWEGRLKNAKKVAKLHSLSLIEGPYDRREWLDFIKGWEDEPEGGRRCRKCFEFNLQKTAEECQRFHIKNFTTTLTISPYKDSKKVFAVAKKIARQYNINFLEKNFKEEEGFKNSVELSKSLNLYRQNYCGCEFSMRREKAGKFSCVY